MPAQSAQQTAHLDPDGSGFALPPTETSVPEGFDILAAPLSIARAAARVGDIGRVTGLSRDQVHPMLKFLTGAGLLTAYPAGWKLTDLGDAVARMWQSDKDMARDVLGEVWRGTWVYERLTSRMARGDVLEREDLARALRPFEKARLSRWVQLVHWLEMARYVEAMPDGRVRVTVGTERPAAGPADSSAAEPPKPEDAEDRSRASATTDAAADPSMPSGLLLPLTMERIEAMSPEDYGSVMTALATIYQALAKPAP